MVAATKRLVLATCQGCGATFERVVGRRKRWCPRCAIERVFAAGDQMKAKAGADYEITVRKQVVYWTSEARRLKIMV